MRRLLALAVAVTAIAPSLAHAQPATPAPPDRMLRVLKRMVGQPGDYVIALGPAPGGAVARSERLRGHVGRMTYLDEARVTPSAIVAEYVGTLTGGGYEVLYRASGDALGGKAFARAAGYADVHLRPGLTVALFASAEQSYFVARRVLEDKDIHFAMYATRVPDTLLNSVIKPAKGEVLVQMDIVERPRED